MIEQFIICYHGTIKKYADRITQEINLDAGRKFTDFGQGFYITNNRKQAEEWAIKKSKDTPLATDINNSPVILVYKIDLDKLQSLKGIVFDSPNDNWGDFVLHCRKYGKNNMTYHTLDYVCGPLADGKIVPLIKRILRNDITPEEFYSKIKPISSENTQLSLHTENAISCLNLLEVTTLYV